MPLVFTKRFTAGSSNITHATISLLQLLNVKVTLTAIEDTLQSHPNYPSLLSMVDGLRNWGVETLSIKTTADKLSNLPIPFIAHLKIKGGWFITVKDIDENNFAYIDDIDGEKKFSRQEFLRNWEGVVLLAEAGEGSGQADYKQANRKEYWQKIRIPAVLLLLFVMGIFSIVSFASKQDQANTVYYSAMLILSFAGMLITGALVWYEYDQNNPLLKQVCSLGKKTNCHVVLNSKAAKLPGNITWSDIGFIYFTGGYLYLLIAGVAALPVLMWLNILALPYILFSLYYQARIAKQWCVFCLTVQGILLSEFIVAFLTSSLTLQPYHLSTFQPIILIISFLLPTISWFFTKSHLYAAKEGRQLRYQLARLKNNEGVFAALLQKQPFVEQSTEGLGIIIGNPEARNTLIKVCNPYCGPCAKVHPKIEELIHNNPDWKAQIIFTATGEDMDIRSAPARHLMAIAGRGDEVIKKQALDDWYNAKQKDYDAFAVKYPMNGELKQQTEKLQAMDKWCKGTGITHTPTFFVNGHRLPEQYTVEDLTYL